MYPNLNACLPLDGHWFPISIVGSGQRGARKFQSRTSCQDIVAKEPSQLSDPIFVPLEFQSEQEALDRYLAIQYK